MAIPNLKVLQLVNEGISEATDLLDFDKDTLHKTSNNLRFPGGRVPEPNYISPGPLTVSLPPVPTIPTPLFIFGAKYQNRLMILCDLIRFYETIGRHLTAANIQWVSIMRNFGEQCKSLTNLIKEDDTYKTKIYKALPITK